MKITDLKTYVVVPQGLFLKVLTDTGNAAGQWVIHEL